MTFTPLPPTRVVTTGHDAKGTSIIASDGEVKLFQPFGPAASAFAFFHSSARVPASNTDPLPTETNVIPRALPGGAVFCTTDIPPGGYKSPMHRTLSLDYTVVLAGEITMKLDGGEETVVKAGQVIVQRGTNHQWVNNGTEVCRMLVVMVGAEAVEINGTKLEETKLGAPPK